MTTTMITNWGRAALGALLAITVILGASQQARALDEAAAEAHVAAMYASLTEIAQTEQSDAARKAAFRDVLLADTAYRDVARLAIGRIWRAMSEEQQQAYVDACITYLTESYSATFNEFDGEELVVGEVVDANEREILISSRLVSPTGRRDDIEVVWRLIERDGSAKVLDVYVEGVSLLVTLRNEFESMLERNGDDIDALIMQMAAR